MRTALLYTLFFLGMTITASAQVSAGLGLHYGSESEIGFSIRGGYDITDNIRGNATFNFLEKEDINVLGLEVESSWRSLDLEGNYFFNGYGEGVYALLGFNINFIKGSVSGVVVSGSETDTKIGLNLGGGYAYPVSDVIDLFGEVKYAIVSDLDQFVVQAGAIYRF